MAASWDYVLRAPVLLYRDVGRRYLLPGIWVSSLKAAPHCCRGLEFRIQELVPLAAVTPLHGSRLLRFVPPFSVAYE